ncbi:hypothetical protein GCM10009534_47510 [Kribbella sandramycini]
MLFTETLSPSFPFRSARPKIPRTNQGVNRSALTQCAAVTTLSPFTSVPPQNCPEGRNNIPGLVTATIQDGGATTSPPTTARAPGAPTPAPTTTITNASSTRPVRPMSAQ